MWKQKYSNDACVTWYGNGTYTVSDELSTSNFSYFVCWKPALYGIQNSLY